MLDLFIISVQRVCIICGMSVLTAAGVGKLSLLLSEEAQGPGTNYEIMGAVSVQVPTNGHYVPYAALPFSIHVANRAWRLTIGTYNGSFFDYVSDGTNIVEVFHDIIRTNLSLPAVLHQDGFPADGGYANLVWLAYASSSHLDKGRTLPAPWLLARHDPQSLMFKTEIERLPGSRGLPRTVVFITDKSRKRDALSHAATKIEGVSYKALKQRQMALNRMPDGVKVASFVVTGTTNMGSLVLPVSFELNQFYHPGRTSDKKVSNKDLRVPPIYARGIRVVGTATHVHPASEIPEWPAVDSRGISVSDRRLQSRWREIDCVQYTITNRWFLDTNSSFLTALLEAKKHNAPFLRLQVAHSVLFWACFGSLLFLPPMLWWLSRMRRRRVSEKFSVGG